MVMKNGWNILGCLQLTNFKWEYILDYWTRNVLIEKTNKQNKSKWINKNKDEFVFFLHVWGLQPMLRCWHKNIFLFIKEMTRFDGGNLMSYTYTRQFFCWILKKCKQATAEVAFLHRLRASLCFSLCNSFFATPINLLIWSAKNTVKVPFGYDDTHHSLFLCCCLEENAIILFFLTRLRLPGAEP